MQTIPRWFRRSWLALAAGSAGILVLVASWVVARSATGADAAWWEGLLVNVGATVLLVAPIAFVSAHLTRQVERVRDDVEAAREETAAVREDVESVRAEASQSVGELRREVESLRDLTSAVRTRLDEEHEAETAAYEGLGIKGKVPSRDDLISALAKATAAGVISRDHGPRAELVLGSRNYLRPHVRVQPFDQDVEVFFDVVTQAGVHVASIPWEEESSIEDVLVELATQLRANGIDPEFDPKDWFERVSQTLVVGQSHVNRHRIIEVVGPQWVVTDQGVVPFPDRQDFVIPGSGLDYEDTLDSNAKLAWVDADSLYQAAHVWQALNRYRNEAPF